MSKRLQVLLEEEELAEVHAAARRQRMTTSEWVRQALRRARSGDSTVTPERKIDLLRRASQHSFPAPDIEEMLGEIERGYLR